MDRNVTIPAKCLNTTCFQLILLVGTFDYSAPPPPPPPRYPLPSYLGNGLYITSYKCIHDHTSFEMI